jgi:hypothetical protein
MLPFVGLGATLAAVIAVSRGPGAEDCPTAEELTARVERIVGRALKSDDGAGRLAVRAHFSRTSAAYEATLQTSGTREGERVLRDEGATCAALADAVAVTTALWLDAAAREPADVREQSEKSGPSWLERLRPFARAGAGGGLTGGPSFVAGGGIEAKLDSLTSIAFGGGLVAPQTHPLGAGSVDVHLWYLELGAFRSLTGDSLRLGPTLLLMAGAFSGQGAGYPSTSSAALPWLAAAGGLRAEIDAGPHVGVALRTLAVLPARKQSFSIGNVGTAYEGSAVAGIAEFIVSVKFW